MFEAVTSVDAPTAPQACECGGTATHTWRKAPAGRVAKSNFYDWSTGQTFATEEDCTRYCRENGISENAPGRFHAEAAIRAVADAEAKDEAEFKAYTEQLQTDPAHGETRRLIEAGYFTDKAKERVAAAGYNPANASINTIAEAAP